MAQLMTVRLRQDERFGLLKVVYYRSKADGMTFDIKDNNKVFCQSIFSYGSLHQAREDARKTMSQIKRQTT